MSEKLFTENLLADEINRAASRTQSALLEAMEEKQITVDGHTYQLDDGFMVMATLFLSGAFGSSGRNGREKNALKKLKKAAR